MAGTEWDPMVNHPPHYTNGPTGMECIDWIEAALTPEEFRGYLKGNALKYQWRYASKGNPITDLEKAQWYIDKLSHRVDLTAKVDIPGVNGIKIAVPTEEIRGFRMPMGPELKVNPV